MTFECGMRFLTDYLQGDTYFKIHRENHNLDRCRTQFKLVSDMEAKWDTMNAIIQKYKETHLYKRGAGHLDRPSCFLTDSIPASSLYNDVHLPTSYLLPSSDGSVCFSHFHPVSL